MAKKKDDDSTTNKVLWYAGAAAVGAFSMYWVNKYLKDREDLNMMRLAERQAKMKALDGGSSE